MAYFMNSIDAKLAKPDEAMAKSLYFGDKPFILETDFFFKNRASSLFCLIKGQLDAKNQRNPMISLTDKLTE